MPSYNIIKLYFRSPVHFGRGIGEVYDHSNDMLHSDTLSGALASAYAQLFGGKDIIEFIKRFSLSSAFPFYKNRFFFPKPMVWLNLKVNGENELKLPKKVKKLEYIEKEIFENILTGANIEVNPSRFIFNGKYLMSRGEDLPVFIKSEVQQRVTVSRDGKGESVPYYLERIYFDKEAGLFFLIEFKDEQVVSKIKSCLNSLADTGLGTDKSVGNGQFSYEINEINFNLPQNPNRMLLFSLYCPGENELIDILDDDCAYLLEKRGGYIAGAGPEKFRHLRKKSVFMFKEGSVFPNVEITGRIIDLRPDWNDEELHQVYRDGRPFILPLISQ